MFNGIIVILVQVFGQIVDNFIGLEKSVIEFVCEGMNVVLVSC